MSNNGGRSRPAVSATESLHAASGVALDELPAENRLSLEDADASRAIPDGLG